MTEHSADRCRIINIRVVFDGGGQRGLLLQNRQGQVKFRGAVVNIERSHGDSRQLQIVAQRILNNEHRLYKGHDAQAALGVQVLNKPFKWKLLVSIGFQSRFAHACEQVVKGHLTAESRAEHEGVYKKPDESFGLHAITPCDG